MFILLYKHPSLDLFSHLQTTPCIPLIQTPRQQPLFSLPLSPYP